MRTTPTILVLAALLGAGCAAPMGPEGDGDGLGALGKADGHTDEFCSEHPDDPSCADSTSDVDQLEGAPSNASLGRTEPNRDETFATEFYDLVALQSPVRSQGRRGVCSIFSTTALMEHLYIAEGTITEPDFSEQYLQWVVKEPRPNGVGSFPNSGGSNANYNLRGISDFGIPWESAWPYEAGGWGTSNDERCEGDDRPAIPCYTNGTPSEDTRAARMFTLPQGRWLSSSERAIKAHMTRENTGVVVGLTFFYQSWHHGRSQLQTRPEYSRNGWVLSPNARDREISLEKRAGHSILLVGWNDDLEVQRIDEEGELLEDEDGNPVMERGFFLFKNSWGTARFGTENPHGAGYGWISYEYVIEHGSAMAGRLPVDVDPWEPGGGDPDPDTTVATGTFENDSATDIPDNDPEGIASEIVVDAEGVIEKLSVSVQIAHTWRGDLLVQVVSPSGTTHDLHSRSGSGADDLRGDFPVDVFDGQEAAGTWTLRVSDHANRDEGTLEGWTIELAEEGGTE